MSDELMVRQSAELFMPIMDIRQAKARRDALVEFVRSLLVADQDFGKIPGTDKPTLLKPGAEKLATFFGLSPVFVSERIVEDFGDDGAEPLFFYRYRCELYRAGTLVGVGIGSCNSRESKYRYRNADRACPNCGKPAITRSKYPPRNQPNAEPGWYCYSKKGGCGTEYGAGDTRIVSQAVGKVPNPDVADLVNTIDKMAQKRALIAATLLAVNASEFFTQDMEDAVVDAEYSVAPPAAHPEPQPPARRPAPQPAARPEPPPTNGHAQPPQPVVQPSQPAQPQKEDNLITEKQLRMLHALGTQVYGDSWSDKRKELVLAITRGEHASAADLLKTEATKLIDGLKAKRAAMQEAPPVGDDGHLYGIGDGYK